MTIPFIGGFESTYQPRFDVDVAETTGHADRWRADLDLLGSCGVSRLRYPVRWHRVEAEPGTYDWRHTDEVLGYQRDAGLRPIVDLVHHTSYPRWLRQGFADRRFAGAYLRYVEAFAGRYPWVDVYTLFNEPFTTFFLCGHEGVWPPYLKGMGGFETLARNVLPAVAEASRRLRDLLPGARHWYVDTCEGHTAAGPAAEPHAAAANARRFVALDRFLGDEGGHVDVLGLDYYAHNQWHWLDGSGRGVPRSPRPVALSALIREYWERYRLPCALTETNIRGFGTDRASWLKYTLEQCELAAADGIPIEGYCWFPFVDSCDWDSVLTRSEGHIDPVGVYWLDPDLNRRPSEMSASYRHAARDGMAARELPAYRFRPPVSDWLAGWLPHMAHWEWLK